jgi:hypothetical protein
MHKVYAILMVLLVGLLLSGSTSAVVIFDPATGMGSVGKEDVQATFGWNNGLLSKNAGSVRFQAGSVAVTEASWTCRQGEQELVQQRHQTSATMYSLVSNLVVVKKQITGFNLLGYTGEPVQTTTAEGAPLHACPDGWVLGEPGVPQMLRSGVALQVSAGGGWTELLLTP